MSLVVLGCRNDVFFTNHILHIYIYDVGRAVYECIFIASFKLLLHILNMISKVFSSSIVPIRNEGW